MLGSYGLRTHIWNNRLKSILLLAGFPVLLLLVCFAFALVIAAFDNPDVGEGIANAVALLPSLMPVAFGAALVWFVIAWFANRAIIAAATGAVTVDRTAEPRLWNLLENLCISRGIPMPSLCIIETDARNAFASGISQSQYTITVTRGLIDALDDAELEGVLAHELTHIRNRDVELLVISAVFVGIISLVADLLIRGGPRSLFWSRSSGGRRWSGSSGGSGRGKGGGGAVILILIAVAIFILARLLATALRFAVSRKREYLADAGAVELTRNPDAMIGALRKIAGHSEITAPAQIQPMFIDLPYPQGFAGLFATHPPIGERIEALKRYAGGHDRIATGAPDASQANVPEFGHRAEPPGAAGADPVSPPERGPWDQPARGPWD